MTHAQTSSSPSLTVRAGFWSPERVAMACVGAAVVYRLVLAASVPLSGDELLYLRYSRHLAAGYLDHPIANPLLIRLGTILLGETSLGARLFGILISIPASFALWRTGRIVGGDARTAAAACIFFNLTLAGLFGPIVATSDAVVMATAAIILWCAARVFEAPSAARWLVLGGAIGLGMLAKYTTVFLGAGVGLAILLSPTRRGELLTPWPYVGALVSLAIFAPVLVWNSEREWASFAYQGSRMVIHEWKLAYVLEFAAGQIGVLTPALAILAVIGLRRDQGAAPPPALPDARLLLACLSAPLMVYFLWHAAHERVQANWTFCLYPPLAVLAALGARSVMARPAAQTRWGRGAQAFAAPFTIAIALLVAGQALFGIIHLGRKDPFVRELSVGFQPIADRVRALRDEAGARVVLAPDYSTTVLLWRHMPKGAEVHQIAERVRWTNEPPPDPRLFDGPIVIVARGAPGGRLETLLRERYGQVRVLDEIRRTVRGIPLETYSVYLVTQPRGPVLNPIFPIRLKEVRYDPI